MWVGGAEETAAQHGRKHKADVLECTQPKHIYQEVQSTFVDKWSKLPYCKRHTSPMKKLQRKCRGQMFSATYSSYARGVTIWVAPQVAFQAQYIKADIEGRYVLVYGLLDGAEIICFLNMYAPNVDDDAVFYRIRQELVTYTGRLMIWAGDFTCVLDGSQDRHPRN